jgi:hypothetical protein
VRKYRHLARTIQRKTELLLKDPYRHCKSELLMRNLFGLRSARLTRNIRILFAILEECRGLKWPAATAFLERVTAEMDARTVVFITVDVHERVYR